MSLGVAGRTVVSFSIALFAAACGSSPEHASAPTSPPPEPVQETGAPSPGGAPSSPIQAGAPVPGSADCGVEVRGHDKGYDAKARGCLWDAYSSGKPVKLTTTSYTTEGDPMTYVIQVVSASEISVVLDSKDKFGRQGMFKATCSTMTREPYRHQPDRYGFHLSGCSGDWTEQSIP